MDMLARAREAGTSPDIDAMLAAVPYCAWLGVTAAVKDGIVTLQMKFDPKLIGNPIIPAIHGGVIGSLLETAAIVQVVWQTGAVKFPRPVDVTIDYLRGGKPVTSYARAYLARQGRRVVNARAEMWQDDETKPIASFRGHFLLA
jgi:uncharacterized protein (TIGR00369 family)